MKRRQFIQTTAAGVAFISMPPALTAASPEKATKITILHTNDVHSHIDPFPPGDAKNPNAGGVSRRAALIESIRKENKHVLLLDAGDVFQGTPYFNYYGGEPELKLMSLMGYDLATIGNHEFDNGIKGFHSQLRHADFDFVNANYDFRNTLLDGVIRPYKVFKKGGVRIGVFGLGVELAGLVDRKNYGETTYLDPVEIATDMSRQLREREKCEIVICLSHLGYKYQDDKISDVSLAARTKGIDLIIGGHTHTFLDKPVIIKNLDGQEVLVNQVGCYGINLGQIDFYLKPGVAHGSGRSIVV